MDIGNPLAESPATDPEDRVLVLRTKSGDRDALEELVGRHQPRDLVPALRRLLAGPDFNRVTDSPDAPAGRSAARSR